MGLRCSLLGHQYGDPVTEREREERGDEVVITVRELRTCRRCDTESVVSENTEVRSVQPADGVESDRAANADPAVGDGGDGAGAGGGDPGVDDEFDSATDPDTDDAVILEDDPEERGPGEWPAAEDTRVDEAPAAPEEGADDRSERPEAADQPGTGDDRDAPAGERGADAQAGGSEPSGGDAEIIDADASGERADTDSESGAGADPGAGASATAGADEEWPDVDVSEAAADPGSVGGDETGRTGATESGSGGQSQSDEDAPSPVSGIERAESSGGPDATTLACPSCSFSEELVGGSHRPGDICPECGRGYLAEQ